MLNYFSFYPFAMINFTLHLHAYTELGGKFIHAAVKHGLSLPFSE